VLVTIRSRFLSSGAAVRNPIAFILVAFCIGLSIPYLIDSAPNRAEVEKKAAPVVKSGHKYPDFGFLPPPSQYEGRVFKLSQEFPKELPPENTIPEIAKRDFETVKKEWKKYLMDVRAYCFEGNVGAENVEDDWRVEKNTPVRWFHMPWQHFGPKGREGIHGMTKEAPVLPRQLAWTQTHGDGQTYAVGFYNSFGGYTLWQVWKDHEHPGRKDGKQIDINFPVGTVVCKVLFVDLDREDKVPSLEPPLQWQAYVTKGYKSTEREIRSLSLIQMDVMVRHSQAPSGWVFGTFQYNSKRPGANPAKPSWDNLIPVGIQWGNDQDVRENTSNPEPTATRINDKLKETKINDDADELPPTHLGWNGRLNGPVDNAMSSCMSCHMTASAPQKIEMSPLFEKHPPAPGSEPWMKWFKSIKCGERFDPRNRSTDFSLQMAMALQNFYKWRDEGSKLQASRYTSKKVPAVEKKPVRLFGVRFPADDDDEVVEIRRDPPRP
jgi:hypothetical protein